MFQYASRERLFTAPARESGRIACDTAHRMADAERAALREGWSARTAPGTAGAGKLPTVAPPTQVVAYPAPTRGGFGPCDAPAGPRRPAPELHAGWIHASARRFLETRMPPTPHGHQ